MYTPKKCSCRWWDGYMDCCRHPSTYEYMRKMGDAIGVRPFFCEHPCHCRIHCGYEKIDAKHPAWNEIDISSSTSAKSKRKNVKRNTK